MFIACEDWNRHKVEWLLAVLINIEHTSRNPAVSLLYPHLSISPSVDTKCAYMLTEVMCWNAAITFYYWLLIGNTQRCPSVENENWSSERALFYMEGWRRPLLRQCLSRNMNGVCEPRRYVGKNTPGRDPGEQGPWESKALPTPLVPHLTLSYHHFLYPHHCWLFGQ